ISRGNLSPRGDNDANSTRRKKLHAVPWRNSAADAGGGRQLSHASTGLGPARRRQADRAYVSLQEFWRGVCFRRTRGRSRRGRRTPSGDQFGWGYATISLQTKKIKGLH